MDGGAEGDGVEDMSVMLYLVVETDNHGSDYPGEKFVSEAMEFAAAAVLTDQMNDGADNWSTRWHKTVAEGCVLKPGFEP